MRRAVFRPFLGVGLALALLAGATLPGVPAEDDPDGGGVRTVDIYMTVEPANLPEGSVQMPDQESVSEPGVPVRISGLTARDFAGQQIKLTISPPEWEVPSFTPEFESEDACPDDNSATPMQVIAKQDPTVIMADVDVNGRFEAEFTPKVEGRHTVEATDASKAHKGEAAFEVVTIELELKCYEIPAEEAEEAAVGLIKNVCDVANALVEGLVTLPDSPAKEEFERQLKAFNEHRAEVLACDEAPNWAWSFRQMRELNRAVPALEPTFAPVKQGLREWNKQAEQAAAIAPKILAPLTHDNLVCDTLDTLINGLKYIEFAIGLLTKPADLVKDWAVENLPPKLLQLAASSVAKNSVVKDTIETGWKNIVGYKPTFEKGRVKIGVSGDEKLNANLKLGASLTTFASSRIFELYCQSFSGPVTARMDAEFYSPNGSIWWRYTIEIKGKLVLRYPADAKGKRIRLTGEFMGNATKFESWDNAIPVLFPEMAMGTVFRTMRFEPIAAGALFQKNFGAAGQDADTPDFNPVSSTLIESGGAITQSVMTPAFFNVPVAAELSDDKLTLQLQKPIEDFDDLRVKVVQVMLPVLSMWPEVIDYALPYKGAQFMLLRAMGDEPAVFTVEKTKDEMKFTRAFQRTKSNAEAGGTYTLSVTACNPGC